MSAVVAVARDASAPCFRMLFRPVCRYFGGANPVRGCRVLLCARQPCCRHSHPSLQLPSDMQKSTQLDLSETAARTIRQEAGPMADRLIKAAQAAGKSEAQLVMAFDSLL